MSESKIVEVINRDHGYVGYVIPESGVKRSFAPQEMKKIELEELKQLSYVPGGEFILKNCLIVNDQSALDALNIAVEPEYFYTEEDIRRILTTGSLDELEDTLNFAPEGVIDLVKKITVEEELSDTRKRELITKITGFNVDNAIKVNRVMNAEDGTEENKSEDKPARKASGTYRKTAAPKVTVVKKD